MSVSTKKAGRNCRRVKPMKSYNVLMILVLLLLSSCGGWESKVDHSDYGKEYFEFEGHDYALFLGPGYVSGIIHRPTCRKCTHDSIDADFNHNNQK